MKLSGLDFETANGKCGSVCAAGCSVLEDGVVLHEREWLVCPHIGYRWMRPDFTEIHGLHHWDVCHFPEFPAIWPELREMLLEADCVIIHNARFDLAQLRAVLALYELPPISFDYVDSVAISRRLYPALPSHSLNTVAEHLGIRFQHHDALEDARTCALIAAKSGIPDDLHRHFESAAHA